MHLWKFTFTCAFLHVLLCCKLLSILCYWFIRYLNNAGCFKIIYQPTNIFLKQWNELMKTVVN